MLIRSFSYYILFGFSSPWVQCLYGRCSPRSHPQLYGHPHPLLVKLTLFLYASPGANPTYHHCCFRSCLAGCEHYLNRSGTNWPHFLSCDRLPDHSCLQISAPAAPSIDIIMARDPMDNAATSQYLLTQTNYRLFMALQAVFCLYSAKVL